MTSEPGYADGEPGTPPAGARRALRSRNFRVFFLGSLVSVPGTWMQMTAQAWLVLQLTNSPLALATVAVLQFLPVTVFSLIGGAIADHYPRRRIMFVTQSLACLQAVLLGLLVVSGLVNIWWIYGLAVSLGFIQAMEAPLRQAFTGDLVNRQQLPNAIALNSMAQNVGRIVGPALGGLVIAGAGVGAAFFINAATFLGTISALLLVRPAEHVHPATAKRHVVSQVIEGFSYARRTPEVLMVLIAVGFIGTFGQNFTTMVPLVAEYLAGASAAEFGILNSCLGSGSFLAALTLSLVGPPTMRRMLAAGSAFGLMLIAISFSRDLVVSSIMFFLVGMAAITFSVSMHTTLQMLAPPTMRGRLASMVALAIPSPIGGVITGLLASGAGVAFAVFFNGLMCCVGMAVTALYMLHVRRSRARQAAGSSVAASRATPAEAPEEPARDAAE